MSLESKAGIISAIDSRVERMQTDLRTQKGAVGRFVQEQVLKHQKGELAVLANNGQFAEIFGCSRTVVARLINPYLTPEERQYRRFVIYRQTLEPRFFQAGTEAPRIAQAVSGGLRAASAETRRRVAHIGSMASREKAGPPGKETLLPLFLRGLSNQDVALITGKSAPVINAVRVSLKKMGELPPGKMKKPVILPSQSPEQSEKFALLRDFFKQRMFNPDLRMWDFLGLVVNHAPKFQRPVEDLLRLEIFFLGKEGEARGEMEVLEGYFDALERRNSAWAKSQRLHDETYFNQVFLGS